MWPRPAEGTLPAGCGGKQRRGSCCEDGGPSSAGAPGRDHSRLGTRAAAARHPARGGVNMPAVTAGLDVSTSARRPPWAALAGAPARRAGRRGTWLPASLLPYRGRSAPLQAPCFLTEGNRWCFWSEGEPDFAALGAAVTSPIRARGLAWRGRADSGDQWDLGSGVGRGGRGSSLEPRFLVLQPPELPGELS